MAHSYQPHHSPIPLGPAFQQNLSGQRMLFLIRNPDFLPHLDLNNLKPGIGCDYCMLHTCRHFNDITSTDLSSYSVKNHSSGTGNNSPYLVTSFMAVAVRTSPYSPDSPILLSTAFLRKLLSPGGRERSNPASAHEERVFPCRFCQGLPGCRHPAYCPLTALPLRFMQGHNPNTKASVHIVPA